VTNGLANWMATTDYINYITLFSLKKHLSKHKMTTCSKHFWGGPWPFCRPLATPMQWQNGLKIRVFEKIEFSSGNLSSLTWALGSLSLLSIRVDSLVINLMTGGDSPLVTPQSPPVVRLDRPATTCEGNFIHQNFCNLENNIRDIRPFCRPLFCHSSVVKYSSFLLQKRSRYETWLYHWNRLHEVYWLDPPLPYELA